MLVTYNWLKEFVDIKHSPRELAEILTMGGLEVESVEELGAGINNVVVGKILKIDKHPNADRLTVCEVDVGKEKLTIVCGAKNMIEGDHVPVALIGAELPGGMKIEKTVLRGVTSHGMMCSTRELGLGEEHAGLLILDKETQPGENIRPVLGMDDVVLSIGVTPNRPDCLSLIGIAREISALTGAKLHLPESDHAGRKNGKSGHISVEVKNKALCQCYCGQMITDVKIGPSPQWLERRLKHVGLRSINNIVDITNYVLFECGHPIHAFDYDLIEGKSIIIRNAAEKETLTTLDGTARELDAEMLVIADARKAVAIAGVMGGGNTEISDRTRNVFLESAYFIPETVRRTAKKLGIQTDSSYRFERGVDPQGLFYALHRAAGLIQKIAGGTPEQHYIEDSGKLPVEKKLTLRVSRVKKILGADISKKDLKNSLDMLQFTSEEEKEGLLRVSVPSYRVDVEREIDLIEEAARIFGYRNIPTVLPEAPVSVAGFDPVSWAKEKINGALTTLGLKEIITYSFVDICSLKWLSERRGDKKIPVMIANPISDDQNVMRTTLVDSMLKAVAFNKNMGAKSVKLFETGRNYSREKERIVEKEGLLIGLMGLEEEKEWFNNEKEIDFYNIKGAVEAALGAVGIVRWEIAESVDGLFQPGSRAALFIGKEPAGTFGRVHPDVLERYDIKKPVFIGEIDCEIVFKHLKTKKGFCGLPKYPAIMRDLALVVDADCPAGRIEDLIVETDNKLVKSVRLFDIFKGGKLPRN